MSAGLKDFASKTSIHGFGHLVSAERKAAKLVWLLLLAGSAAILIYHVYDLLDKYQDPDTRWVFSSYERRKEVTMPNITICNMNRLRKSKIMEYNMSSELVLHFLGQPYFLARFPVQNYSAAGKYQEFDDWLKEKKIDWIDVIDQFSHPCESTLIAVDNIGLALNGYHLNGKSICESNYSTRYVYSMEYGRCLQLELGKGQSFFKSVDDMKTKDGFAGNQLVSPTFTLILDTNLDEYLEMSENNYLVSGFAVQTSYSGMVDMGSWIKVGPGQQLDIAIQKHEMRVKEPKQDILPDCKLNTTLETFEEYSPSYCYIDCIMTSFEYHCLPLLTSSPRYTVCTTDEMLDFLNKSYTISPEDLQSQIERFGNCTTLCVPACQSDQVDVTVSSTTFPSEAQSETFRNVLLAGGYEGISDDTVIKERFTAIDIHFKNQYVKVTERHQRTTFGELVSNVGGQMGLWLGMSIVTLAHVLTYPMSLLIEFVSKCIERLSNRKTVVSKNICVK